MDRRKKIYLRARHCWSPARLDWTAVGCRSSQAHPMALTTRAHARPSSTTLSFSLQDLTADHQIMHAHTRSAAASTLSQLHASPFFSPDYFDTQFLHPSTREGKKIQIRASIKNSRCIYASLHPVSFSLEPERPIAFPDLAPIYLIPAALFRLPFSTIISLPGLVSGAAMFLFRGRKRSSDRAERGRKKNSS